MSKKSEKFRIESDLLGEVSVPIDKKYGGQTQRALSSFPLRGEKCFADYPELLSAMLMIKLACAKANLRAGQLDEKMAGAIMETVHELLLDIPCEHFQVHAFHGGGGISFNMNVNEVIANIANKTFFGKEYGTYSPIHPNDHVNLNQSTNDVFASGCHLAIIKKYTVLDNRLAELERAVGTLKKKYAQVMKISRTCLQDAVEISCADFFGGYASFVSRANKRLKTSVDELFRINLGGSIIGRMDDVDQRYFIEVIPILRDILDDNRLERSTNLFDASQNIDDMVNVGSQVNLLARGLIKIAKDLRLMASGPQTGFGEIELPAIQPGSSAMPGKINPSVPEFLVQSCFQAIGRCTAVEMALDHGELDLNVWEAPVVTNILDAMSCLENGVAVFTRDCVEGMKVNISRNQLNTESIIPLMTRIKMERGYSYATRIYKETAGDIETIKKLSKK